MSVPQGISHIDGKYRVLAQLGQGGTADVSLAVANGPSGFNKLVVLKSMKVTLRDEPDLARMFLNEARLAARLSHPNIVQTNEVFEFEGLPVIVMEYLEGQPLSSVNGRAQGSERLTTAMQLKVLSEALAGLHYSHELEDFDGSPLGLVHRDVSPHNVFITFDGQVKVLDFGIAKLASSRHHTATGVVKGKLHYMAPEQIVGDAVDRRADVYAAGVMLWEVAAGQRMWPDMHDATVMNHVVNGEIPRASDVRTIDPELERIIEKALAFDPGSRYESAHALQVDLEAYLAARGSMISLRDVGKVVGDLFEDTRRQTKKLIETQLSRVPTLSAAEYAATMPLELNSGTHSGYTAGSRSDPPGQAAKRRAGRGMFVLGASVLALGVVVIALARPKSEAAASSASAPAAAAPTVNELKLRVIASPVHAKVFIDDELMPSNPYSKPFSGERGKKHRVRAEAPDHQTESREIVLDADADIVLVLEKLAAKPEPVAEPSVARPTRRAATVAKPIKAAAADDCKPPYYFDDQGFKKYKPQCL